MKMRDSKKIVQPLSAFIDKLKVVNSVEAEGDDLFNQDKNAPKTKRFGTSGQV